MKRFLLAVLILLALPSLTTAQTNTTADVDTLAQSQCTTVLNINMRYRMRDLQTNNEVSALQDFLNVEGYLDYQPTGFFGLATLAAVKKFQSASGYSPTGYVGPLTRAKVNSMSCGTGVTVTPTQYTSVPTPKVSTPPIQSSFPSGCSSTVGFSVTTGNRCNTPATPTVSPAVQIFPAGCTSSIGYSGTTGKKCDGITPATQVYLSGCTSTSGWSSTTGKACDGSTPLPKITSVEYSASIADSGNPEMFSIIGYNLIPGSKLQYTDTLNPSIVGYLTYTYSSDSSKIVFGGDKYTGNMAGLYNVKIVDPQGRTSNSILVDTRVAHYPAGCASNVGYSGTTGSSCSTTTTPAPALTVLSPNGGESFVSGQDTIHVTYKSANISGQLLTAYLYSPTLGSVRSALAYADNSGTIDLQLAKGGTDAPGQYKVNLCAMNVTDTTSGKTLCDISNNYFTLNVAPSVASVAPVITVLSPNSGENIITGNTYRITWDSDPKIDKVAIMLVSDTGTGDWINSNIQNNNYYDWAVSKWNTTSTKFKIRVIAYQTGVGSWQDESDGYFNLASNPTTTPAVTLVANPTSITSGQSSTLTLSSVDTAGGCVGANVSDGKTSGTNIVYPTQTTTYTVTCYELPYSGGRSVSASVTVNVSTPVIATPIISSISPLQITAGATTQVTLVGLRFDPTLVIALTGPGADTSVSQTGVSSDGKTMTFNFPSTITVPGTYSVQVLNYGVQTYSSINVALVAPVIATPTIKLLSPNGGETIAQNSQYTVQWNTSSYATSTLINIYLFTSTVTPPTEASYSAGFVSTLVSSTPNDGSEVVTIPSGLAGTTYFIRVMGRDMTPTGTAFPNGCLSGCRSDDSDAPFTISAASTQSASVIGAFATSPTQQAPAVVPTSTFKYAWDRNLEVNSPYVDDVSALQTALTKEGAYTGDITGGFYAQTYLAVKAFQSKYGIEATGFVGPTTRAKLNELY